MEQRPAENLIGAESTDGCTHQHQILPALGVAPQTVIGLEQKLSNDGAPIQQQHIFREAAFGADLGIRQQYCDELVTCHCHCEQKRIAEEQQLFPKSAHIGTPSPANRCLFLLGGFLRLPFSAPGHHGQHGVSVLTR